MTDEQLFNEALRLVGHNLVLMCHECKEASEVVGVGINEPVFKCNCREGGI